jgi:hypothetical protein
MTLQKSKQSKMYFTQDTEQAIIEYNRELDAVLREKIFRERIYPALDKMVESIINRFKFPYIDERYEDIKNEVISFIVLNLHMFTEGKGKAFSYFSVVAKNYLILKNNASYKEGLRSSYLNDTSNDESFSLEEVLTVEPESETHRHDAKNFIQLLVQYWDFNLTRIFKKKKDLEVANAVVELLRRSNTTENFNKKALYLLIREMTNYKTVHITKVLNKMKIYVFQQLKEYRQTGHISDPSTFFTYKQQK